MALKYDVDIHLKALSQVREEHMEWYCLLVRRAFYPETLKDDISVLPPESFLLWLRDAQQMELSEASVLDNLKKLNADLHEAGDKFLTQANENTRPEAKKFNALSVLFEEFLNHLSRLEHDCLLENSGLDPLTGLRSKHVLIRDLEREMERLARQGKSFTVAMARIDNFDQIINEYGEADANQYTKLVADLIKVSLRSFDDAYVSGANEYVLCLKQSDIPGGVRALERLRKVLEEEGINLVLERKKVPLSLSCCIAEPLPEDGVEDLLAGLRKDLHESAQSVGTVLEYHEMSPLQRFVQKQGG